MSAPAAQRVPYRTLIWLAISTFALGIDGYVLTGLLPAVAADLEVTVAAAGQLMTAFALASALLAPVLVALTGRFERRATIVAALIVFIVGNLIVALAPGYAVAMIGRIVTAAGGGLLLATASAYALAITPFAGRGKALSFVLGGWMVATAVGVPVGLVVGAANWRLPLVMVAGVAVVALIGVLLRLARLHLPTVALAVRLRPLAGPRFVAGLSVTVGVLCASYCCFTYATVILAPAGATGLVLVAVLFAYGVASTLGNALSGRLVDRFPPGRVLTVLLVVLAANALIGMAVVGTAASLVLVVGSVAWFLIAGVGNGGAAVPIQARLTALAPDAAADALALNGSAISLGGALGSGIGGIALAAGFVPAALLGISALILGATLTVHLLALRVRPVVAA